MTGCKPWITLPPSRWERAGLLLAVILVWGAWMVVPQPPFEHLDASWQAALADHHAHGRQFGRDVLFTHGPWGWLESVFTVPAALAGQHAWNLAGKLLLAAAAVAVTLGLPAWRRWSFLAAFLFLGQLFPDTRMVALVALLTLGWLFDPKTPWAVAGGVAMLFGLLTALKFVFVPLTLAAVGLATAGLAWRGEWKRAGALAGVYAAAVVVWWMLAGQTLALLPEYWRLGAELSAGYAGAMVLDEPPAVFLAGTIGGALVAAFLWGVLRSHGLDRRLTWPASAFLAGVMFLGWKHGFTRGDGHVFGFFILLLLLALAVPPRLRPDRPLTALDAGVLVGLAGLLLFDPALVGRAPGLVRLQLADAFQHVVRPGAWREGFLERWERQRAAAARPEVEAAIGAGTVDLLGHDQALLLLRGLNYRPRPVFQSYSAYTPTLLRRNERFFRSARAPEFVIVDYATIDGRFPTQDDSLALVELRRRYERVPGTGTTLVLRRRSDQPGPAPTRRETLLDTFIPWGQPVELPPGGGQALWLQAWFEPSRLGRWRALLYKPAQATMIVTDSSGRETRHRLVPGIAGEGFVIQPFLETPLALAAFFDGAGRQWVRTVRFEPAAPDEQEFWRAIHLRLSALPEVAVDPNARSDLFTDSGVTDLEPIDVHSAIAVQPIDDDSIPGLLVHAPGGMVFAPGERRCLEAVFGLRAGSYSGEGATDGAEFSVEAEFADGRSETVWRRLLTPRTVAADQGPQPLALALPTGVVRCTLRITPGPSGSADWDWTFWRQIRFSACAPTP